MASGGIALVTGGARRIGAAIVKRLAAEGWDVCIHYNTSATEAVELRDALIAQGRRCTVMKADLRKSAEALALVSKCERHFGAPATALVNNASLFEYDTLQTLAPEHLQKTLDINFVAPILLAQAFAKASGGEGCIVNLLDQKVRNLNPDFFSYTLSKVALASATELLARVLAPVRVCGVAPGSSLPSADETEDEFLRARRATPLGRTSTPEDVADAVLFLLRSKAVTGEVLTVDGGQHLLAADRDIMFLQRALTHAKTAI
jgi:NAD(P)-dependent dehydrogenase (short-subunit alcohol dehydrogenase family)